MSHIILLSTLPLFLEDQAKSRNIGSVWIPTDDMVNIDTNIANIDIASNVYLIQTFYLLYITTM